MAKHLLLDHYLPPNTDFTKKKINEGMDDPASSFCIQIDRDSSDDGIPIPQELNVSQIHIEHTKELLCTFSPNKQELTNSMSTPATNASSMQSFPSFNRYVTRPAKAAASPIKLTNPVDNFAT